MARALDRFNHTLDQPLFGKARLALALLVVPLALSYAFPLWRISMEAPQYPEGLYLDVYNYKLGGGEGGRHLAEINNLNHYIGMRKIDRAELNDLDWISFALAFLGLFALRVAAIGNVRALFDLTVMSLYISAFSFVRFAYKLYTFGHNLDPTAAFKVEPFMPALFGTKQIANFTTHSFPRFGTLLVGTFVCGAAALLAWQLVAGARASSR